MSYSKLWKHTMALRYANTRGAVLDRIVKLANINHLRVTEWFIDTTRTMKDHEKGRALCMLPPNTPIVSVATKHSVLIGAGFETVSCPDCIAIIQGTASLHNQFHLARDP